MSALPRTDSITYDLRQRLDRAVRWLREAEDIARIEMPGWPTADRIREIYEQVTADVLNGRTSVPPLQERHDKLAAENEDLHRQLGDEREAKVYLELDLEELRGQLREARQEVERLRLLILRAPHARHCEAAASIFPGPCGCWKGKAALNPSAPPEATDARP